MPCPNCEMARIRQMIENKQRQRALEEQKRIADMIAKKKEARMLEKQKLKEEAVVSGNVVGNPTPEEVVAEPVVKAVYESPVIEIIKEPEVEIEEVAEHINKSDDINSEDSVGAPIVQKPVQQQKPKTNYSKKKKKSNKK